MSAESDLLLARAVLAREEANEDYPGKERFLRSLRQRIDILRRRETEQ